MTRREAITRLFGKRPPVDSSGASARATEAAPTGPPVPRVAVIAARQCIALPPGFCRVCVERCPLPGAMSVINSVPMVNAAVCDGCGLCAEVCPAPGKAVLMLPRRDKLPLPHAS
jgi:Pyruvate/2-oxoacid:ferredoxin oxidoreductase delta subunit